MPRRALNDSLERLRSELAASASLSAVERERLEALLRDVASRADGDGEDEDEETSLADRLQEATQQFEDEHPNLTIAIGAVADALSKLGI